MPPLWCEEQTAAFIKKMAYEVRNQKAFEFYQLVKQMRNYQKRSEEMGCPSDVAQATTFEQKVDAIIKATEEKINPQQQTLNL